MSDIKNVISILCKHLNFMLGINLRPELFRLSKFDGTNENVVSILWNLLYKFVNGLSESNSVLNTKIYLMNMQYKCVQFYALPEDMSSGSRELLLAFGFIVCNGGLDKIISHEISRSPFDPSFEFKNKSSCDTSFLLNVPQPKEEDFENTIKWIEGRTKQKVKMIEEYKSAVMKLQDKLDRSVSIPKVKHLSLTEIMALNNEGCAKVFLEKTERITTIFENHQNWLKNEHIFWDWMKTVVVERRKNNEPVDISNLKSFCKVVNGLIS